MFFFPVLDSFFYFWKCSSWLMVSSWLSRKVICLCPGPCCWRQCRTHLRHMIRLNVLGRSSVHNAHIIFPACKVFPGSLVTLWLKWFSQKMAQMGRAGRTYPGRLRVALIPADTVTVPWGRWRRVWANLSSSLLHLSNVALAPLPSCIRMYEMWWVHGIVLCMY